jgi:Uma2 family endonuclease
VVEISSPSTRDVDWGSKRRSYASGGASWYWIVELRRLEIVVFEHRDGDLVEIQRITTPALAAGPFPVLIDPGAFPTR